MVAIDVDGTLASSAGPVTKAHIKALEKQGIRWGILSSRSQERSLAACRELGICPAFVMVCRIDHRAEELRQLKEAYPDENIYIYIADTERDHQEALAAGWDFVFAQDIERFLAVAGEV